MAPALTKPSDEELKHEIENCYHPKLIQGDLCARVEGFLRPLEPKIIKFGQFKTDLISRPKLVWGIPNADGEYPLYYF